MVLKRFGCSLLPSFDCLVANLDDLSYENQLFHPKRSKE